MKTICVILSFFLFANSLAAQPLKTHNASLYFISDTQDPLLIEKIIHKPYQNQRARNSIFSALLQQSPAHVYILGDVVALGYANRRWKAMDSFLDSCRAYHIPVEAILGNHELMIRKRKGIRHFQQRFPANVPTGYVSVQDSIAVVLLNSNFKKLSAADRQKQSEWYATAMAGLDKADSIKAIIVCCHHAPYTNSRVVKGSTAVQQYFVPAYIASSKARLFITGHSHNFEHFRVKGKDFLVIGGGGGIQQGLRTDNQYLEIDNAYTPRYHYLSVNRSSNQLLVSSHYLRNDFSGFEDGLAFTIELPVVPLQ
ncbi:MAG: metallophosphoesterase [Chitinophagaceae bacterium]